MPPKVICVKKKNLNKLGYSDLEEWLDDPKHVYIGRDMTFYVKGAVGSKWQNPFPVKKHGLDECIKLFEKYLLTNKELMNQIKELKGKDLGCWCKNNGDEHCHGDLLLKLANSDPQ